MQIRTRTAFVEPIFNFIKKTWGLKDEKAINNFSFNDQITHNQWGTIRSALNFFANDQEQLLDKDLGELEETINFYISKAFNNEITLAENINNLCLFVQLNINQERQQRQQENKQQQKNKQQHKKHKKKKSRNQKLEIVEFELKEEINEKQPEEKPKLEIIAPTEKIDEQLLVTEVEELIKTTSKLEIVEVELVEKNNQVEEVAFVTTQVDEENEEQPLLEIVEVDLKEEGNQVKQPNIIITKVETDVDEQIKFISKDKKITFMSSADLVDHLAKLPSDQWEDCCKKQQNFLVLMTNFLGSNFPPTMDGLLNNLPVDVYDEEKKNKALWFCIFQAYKDLRAKNPEYGTSFTAKLLPNVVSSMIFYPADIKIGSANAVQDFLKDDTKIFKDFAQELNSEKFKAKQYSGALQQGELNKLTTQLKAQALMFENKIKVKHT